MAWTELVPFKGTSRERTEGELSGERAKKGGCLRNLWGRGAGFCCLYNSDAAAGGASV